MSGIEWIGVLIAAAWMLWVLYLLIFDPTKPPTAVRSVGAHRDLGQPTCCGSCVARWARDVELQRRVELEDLERLWEVSNG